MKTKRKQLVIGAFSVVAIYAFGEFQVDFGKIRHWSGKGDNEAALVIQFLDDFEKKAIVWGYRWEEGKEATGEEMIREIARQSDDICALVQMTGVYGSTLDGVGYSKNNEILSHLYYDFEGASEDPYIMFDYYSPNIMMGQHKAPGEEAERMCEQAISGAKESHIIEHPLNYADFGYPAYDYDWWKADSSSPDMRWNAGWYAGYWSYWLGHRNESSDEYAYSGLGMSSVKLKPGDVNAWKYMPLDGPVNPDDFVDGQSGASIAWADALDYTHFDGESSSTPIFVEERANEQTDVYDIHGKYIGRFKKGERFNLPKGIYVGKVGDKTVKFYKK